MMLILSDSVSDSDSMDFDELEARLEADEKRLANAMRMKAETIGVNEDLVEKIKGVKHGKPEEMKGKKSENVVACTKELVPYCCGNVQYDNACLAKADGKDTDSECEQAECYKEEDEYTADKEEDDKDEDDKDEDKDEDDDEYSEVPEYAAKMDKCGCEVAEAELHCCGKGDKAWADYASICDAECDGKVATDCLSGTCQALGKTSAATVGHKTYLGGGLEATAGHSSQWNIMIVIIQLCILAVCCMSLGLSISFCFKNPNQLMGAGKKSFGPD